MSKNAETVAPAEDAPDFSSVHTSSFPALLAHLKISLVVSTYQAGKLIVLRSDGGVLNTHFRQFPSPMGVAYCRKTQALAVGTRNQVWTFRNHPSVADKFDPPGKHDAVFLPRDVHYSGDIRIHEIGWVDNEIWAVNTRFSCLSTFDRQHSFVPRWRPPFVSACAAEDRCHLNGMAKLRGRVRLVTFLAQTDTPGGWREHKRDGGGLWDLAENRLVVGGLCMPHSPRFHRGDIWLLESGVGAISKLDAATQTVLTVARLPGFTRGLCFAGRYAFVGLSQIRESAIFGGIPIAESKEERCCGVWALDLETGETVAFVRFEGTVQEIFAVELLPNVFPEITNEQGPVLDLSFMLPPETLASSKPHAPDEPHG